MKTLIKLLPLISLILCCLAIISTRNGWPNFGKCLILAGFVFAMYGYLWLE